MSYNIDSTEYLSGGPLRIHQDVVDMANSELEYRLPEGCFIFDLGGPPNTWHDITHPSWVGEGSGNEEDTFKYLLSQTKGSADILLTWEGGDSFSGLRVVDGTVTEHRVVHMLGEEV
jgi:hypothetical protein